MLVAVLGYDMKTCKMLNSKQKNSIYASYYSRSDKGLAQDSDY
jgi:hypothetical protein